MVYLIDLYKKLAIFTKKFRFNMKKKEQNTYYYTSTNSIKT